MKPEGDWSPKWWASFKNFFKGTFLGIDDAQMVEDANTLAASGGATDRKSLAAAKRLGKTSKTIETATGAAKETVKVLSQTLPYAEESLMATYAATGQYGPLEERVEDNAPYMIVGALLPGSSGMYKKRSKIFGKNFDKISDNLFKKTGYRCPSIKKRHFGQESQNITFQFIQE